MNKYRLRWEQIIISLLIGIAIGCIISEILSKNWEFFKITFDNIIDYAIAIFIGYGIYKFGKKDSREEKRNKKIEELLEQIVEICENNINIDNFNIENFEIRLYIRRISNALEDLKKLTNNTKYEEAIKYIDANYVEFEKYMSEHSEMSLSQLIENEDRKNRIVDYISKIKDKSNEVLCDIWTE